MLTRALSILFVAALAAPLAAQAANSSGPTGSHVVVSDIGPYSFSVSWATPSATSGRVQVQVNGKWKPISDVRGNVSATTHLFNVDRLKSSTLYAARAIVASNHVVTLHVRTTPVLPPKRQISAVGGQILANSHKPISQALVYVTLRQGSDVSIPLATLTLPTGRWVVALANAVTRKKAYFPLVAGEQVTIRALTGRGSAVQIVKLASPQQLLLLKEPIVVH